MYDPSLPEPQLHVAIFHIYKQTDPDVERLESLLNNPDVKIVRRVDEFDKNGGYHVVLWYKLEKG